MKRLIACLIFILIVIGGLSACTTNVDKSTLPDPEAGGSAKETPSVTPDGSSQETGSGEAENNETGEMAGKANYAVAYIDVDGKLKLRNLKDGSEQTVVEGDNVRTYDFNMRDGLVGYIVWSDDEDMYDEKVTIYDMKTGDKSIIDPQAAAAREVRWSPDGKYLAVDYGTDYLGSVRIYDINEKQWVGGLIITSGFIWSPEGDAIALSPSEPMDPPIDIGNGDSSSTAILILNQGMEIKTILKGTRDFMSSPVEWSGKDTLVFCKMFYENDEMKFQYYEADINGSDIKPLDWNRTPYDGVPGLPEEVSQTLHRISPDEKLVLYIRYDENTDSTIIMVWDVEKKSAVELCPGDEPGWVAQP